VDVAFSFTAAMPYFWRTPGTDEFSATETEWEPAASALTE
jgi:hypothetical protein